MGRRPRPAPSSSTPSRRGAGDRRRETARRLKRTGPTAGAAKAALRRAARPHRAALAKRFFKIGPGEYGEGDVFLGCTVPQIRALAKRFESLSFPQLRVLLRSLVHEDRFLALAILVARARRAERPELARLHRFYLAHLRHVNNWDLVDVSAPDLVGRPIAEAIGSAARLDRLARSRRLWDRRVAVLATFHFIRRGRLRATFRLAKTLLRDEEDLLHKATGWMLREAGRRDPAALCAFLDRHAPRMPRTMLRYATERMSSTLRAAYLDSR